MKKTKREQSSIIIYFSIYLIFTLWLVYFVASYILPSIKEIEVLKSSVSETYWNINRVKKEWLNLKEFQDKLATGLVYSTDAWKDNLYMDEILKSIDEKFYNDNIKNSSEENFDLYIKKISDKYSSDTSFDEKWQLISSILPVYSEYVSDLWPNSLSDYKFINYIESIVETFNLDLNNSIWITELKILDNYSIWLWDTSLETNIFYIPMSFNVSWNKSAIIDFLHFIDNLWKIELDKNNNIIIKSETNIDFSNFKNLILKWQVKNEKYNIFSNQIFDIETIEFWEYIDSSFDIKDTEDTFISYLKSSQWNDKFSAKIELRFYVKWMPMFKIEKYIKDFVQEFAKIKGEVWILLWDTNISSSDKQKLNEINGIMNQLQWVMIVSIQKSLVTKENIEESYKQVNSYKAVLEDYKKTLEQIKTKSWNTAK